MLIDIIQLCHLNRNLILLTHSSILNMHNWVIYNNSDSQAIIYSLLVYFYYI